METGSCLFMALFFVSVRELLLTQILFNLSKGRYSFIYFFLGVPHFGYLYFQISFPQLLNEPGLGIHLSTWHGFDSISI